jgi:hypothetical protein
VVNVYGEGGVKIRYCMRDLMWRPIGRLVRFVAVIPVDEYGPDALCPAFRQAVRLIGSFFCHFWMMDMKPLRYRNGNQHLHRESDSLPRQSPPQNSCLPAGWHHRPRPATVSLGRVSEAGVGVVRLLAQNNSSRRSTISALVVGHMMRETISDFIVNCAQKQFSCKIHH